MLTNRTCTAIVSRTNDQYGTTQFLVLVGLNAVQRMSEIVGSYSMEGCLIPVFF